MKIFYTVAHKYSTSEYCKEAIDCISEIIGGENLYSPRTRKNFIINDSEDPLIIEKAIAQKEHELKNSDILIADITKSSAGVGFYISSALTLKKQVLVLKHISDLEGESYDSITKSKNKLLEFTAYNDTKDMRNIISRYINKSKNKVDTKFILILPSEIDRYLTWLASQKRLHKAQIVRNAIEIEMEQDKEWKAAQRELQ